MTREVAKVVAIVGSGEKSPFKDATWLEVMQHMAKRVSWIDPGIQMLVFPDTEAFTSSSDDATSALASADVVVGVCLRDPEAVTFMAGILDTKSTVICFDSAEALQREAVLGGVKVDHISAPLRALANTGIWKKGSVALQTAELVRTCWARHQADDVWFTVLALVNAFVAPVAELKSLRAAGLEQLQCMIGNCRKEIVECFSDPDCRAAINCLNACGPTDQVCSYTCIVSYESPKLEAFSLCVLQKHRCLGLSAEIRTLPVVHPMTSFRGSPLTHDTAEGIFTGWIGKHQFSWRVVAGQNAAYDQFPCQFQIYYKGKARGSFWYDPVFKVEKLDGNVVWRRRHYRVRRAQVPGTFTFSVLDNGVISEEFWRIVDAPDDLSWGLFYYSGAAKAAGQAYTGAVLCSPDGKWPDSSYQERLVQALDRCGIKDWELYSVDNSSCENPPLGLPDDAPEQTSLLEKSG